MDLPRKLGIAVAFIIPTFVFSGLIYAIFDSLTKVVSWLGVLAVVIVMAILYSRVITGKFLTGPQES